MKKNFLGLSLITLLFGIFLTAFMVSLNSCTENSKVKKFGGTATFELPAGEKLINATWKNEEFWYLTRPMRPGETAETYTFKEKSSYGLIEGTYIIKESGSGPRSGPLNSGQPGTY